MKWACLLFFFSSLAHASCTVTDALGRTVHLDKPAQRIISLAPDITEIIVAAGAENKLVGVIQGSDYPASVKQLPQVGSYAGLDLERILALKPDLIVAWGDSFSRQLQTLAQFHIPIYLTQPKHLEAIPQTLQQMGCLAGTTKTADNAAAQFRRVIQHWEQHNRGRRPVSVFFQLDGYALMTINGDSWISEVIALCGGKNVFAETKWIAPRIDQEAVVTSNPEVMLSPATNDQWKTRWQHWPNMLAVKYHRLYSLHPDWIERAGPRLAQGINEICLLLDQDGPKKG